MDNQLNISNLKKIIEPENGQTYQKNFEFLKQKQKLLDSIVLEISNFSEIEKLCQTTVKKLRNFLENDRVIIYQFQENGSGKIVAESVVDSQLSILGRKVKESCFNKHLVKYYQQATEQNLVDIENTKLNPDYAELFTELQVKANIFVPILLKNNQLLENGKKQNNCSSCLWGLLITQNCSYSRNWESGEVEFLKQLSIHLSIAIQQDLLSNKLAVEREKRKLLETDLEETKKQLEAKATNNQSQLEKTPKLFLQDSLKNRFSTIIQDFDNQVKKNQGFAVIMGDITDNSEQQIRLKLLEKAIISSSNGIVITDATQHDNPIIYVNPGFEQITGYNAQEVIGKNPRFLQGEENQQAALERLRASLKAETHAYVTLKNYRKDQTVFWNELTISPIRDQQGNLTHYVGVQKDITERVEAEKERDRFFEISINLLCIANFEGYFLKLNPAWEETLGHTLEELLSEPFLNFVHPEDRESTKAELEKICQGSSVIHFENRYRCKDGSYCWLMWNSTPLTELGKMYAVASDITELKKNEQALKKSEERFRTVADFTYDWEYWLNPEGKFIYVSPSCERITGYTPEEFLENPNLFKTIVHPQDWQMVKQYFADSFETDSTYSMDFRIITRGGETKWIGHRCQTVYSQDRRWLGRRVSNRDISDYKQMEISLRDSEERFRSIFAQAGVAIIQATATGELLLFNQKFVELVKYSPEELLHKKLTDIIHPE
ncbi:MAG: PAS domain S-box protein, partial [Trichodesmium sp.]